MDLGLKERVVLVTGSSAGIGRATALAFGKEGAKVAVTYRTSEAEAARVAAEINETGGAALTVPFDLANPASIREAVQSVIKEWGRLDVLINNAAQREGPGQPGHFPLFEEVESKSWRSFIEVTLGGVYETLQAVVPYMRAKGWGRIVSVSSTQVEDGFPGLAYYTTAKSGLHGLTATLARELGGVGILSNVVMPGFTLTEKAQQWQPAHRLTQLEQKTATRRLATPQDIANVILFLSSGLNTHINGEAIRVDGGLLL